MHNLRKTLGRGFIALSIAACFAFAWVGTPEINVFKAGFGYFKPSDIDTAKVKADTSKTKVSASKTIADTSKTKTSKPIADTAKTATAKTSPDTSKSKTNPKVVFYLTNSRESLRTNWQTLTQPWIPALLRVPMTLIQNWLQLAIKS